MDPAITRCLSSFSTISLQALEEKAGMLDRMENKYIVTGAQLTRVLAALIEHCDVLEIDGNRTFQYSTRYFDDVERTAYYDHHQGRRKRTKARVRSYVDAGLNVLEVKMIEKRGMTVKRRLRIEGPLDVLDDLCLTFIDHCCREGYDQSFDKPVIPVIVIDYQRITLVAKEGGERLTIDTNMHFISETASCSAPADVFIVETKSKRGNGIADKVMRSLHVQPTKSVSKYCISLVVTGQVVRRNTFLPAIRRLRLIEPTLLPAVNFSDSIDDRAATPHWSVRTDDGSEQSERESPEWEPLTLAAASIVTRMEAAQRALRDPIAGLRYE